MTAAEQALAEGLQQLTQQHQTELDRLRKGMQAQVADGRATIGEECCCWRLQEHAYIDVW